MTTGFEKASSFVRRSEPSAHAVCAVKVGNESELSIIWISSSSRGGMGMIGSVAIVDCIVSGYR